MNLINHNDQIEKSFRRLMTPEANLNFVFLSVNKLHGEETDRRGHTLPLTLDLTTGSSAGGLPDSQIDAVTDEFDTSVSENCLDTTGVVTSCSDIGAFTLVIRDRAFTAVG